MIKVFRYELVFGTLNLHESIFDKIELWDLKNALRTLLPYIELTIEEYESIKDKITMDIKIRVNDYYGNPSYYSVMPQALFDLLEAANLNGEEYMQVDKAQFDKMIENYKLKIDNHGKSN